MKKVIKKFLADYLSLEIVSNKTNKKLYDIFYKYSDFTMIPEKNYIENLKLIMPYKNSKGAVIECGVWRGGMIAGMAEILGRNRMYYLFDSFEGLPKAKDIDGGAAIRWQNNRDGENYYDNCSASEDYVVDLLEKLKVSYQVNKGWFNVTIPKFNKEIEIDVLRLDADWYDSTYICLDYFFPKLREGGIVIIDDYYVWEGCSKAVHDYLSKIKSNCVIRSGVGFAYIIKK